MAGDVGWGKDDGVGCCVSVDESILNHVFRGEVPRTFPFLIYGGFLINGVVGFQKFLWDRRVVHGQIIPILEGFGERD